MRPAGETRDAAGNRCTIFNWDRPFNRSYVIRYMSESCDSPEHTWKTPTPYVRSVIPLSESTLGSEQNPTTPSDELPTANAGNSH